MRTPFRLAAIAALAALFAAPTTAAAATTTTSGTVGTRSTDWTLTYPGPISAGDLVLAIVARDGGTTPVYPGTWPSGWVSGAAREQGSAVTIYLGKLKALGGESGSFTVTFPNASEGAWHVLIVPAAAWTGILGTTFFAGWNSTDGGVVASQAQGSSLNPDPPEVRADSSMANPWIVATAVDGGRAITAWPTGYADGMQGSDWGALTGGGSNGATLGFGTSASDHYVEDPGPFGIARSDQWVAVTIAISKYGS